MTARPLTAERLREALHYDPTTGVFCWLIHQPPSAPGKRAGGADERGYVRITIDGSRYRANRLAWLYMRGTWPEGVVDHVNGDTSDDRFANLRDISFAANTQNRRRAHRGSASGLIGAHKTKNNRYSSSIQHRGKQHQLGTFATPIEAHRAYVDAKRALHEGCTL